MANWVNLLARTVTRMALGRTVRTLFKTVKPKKTRRERNQNRRRNRNRNNGNESNNDLPQQVVEQAPQTNYYKIGFLILLVIVLLALFYLVVEKKLPFLQ